jgi:virginiamycin B lyase
VTKAGVPILVCLILVTSACAAQSARSRTAPGASQSQAATVQASGSPANGSPARRSEATPSVQEYYVPVRSGPHDVAPAGDGGVWFTAQAAGALGRLDPSSGATRSIKLGDGSAPHGVIIGPDGAPWVTDGGLNAIVRVDPTSGEMRRFPLPTNRPNANLNTAVFDRSGRLWFTGQAGVYGRLNPSTGEMTVYDAPRGPGPYGITVTPSGDIYYASLAGNYLGRIDPETGNASVLEPPTHGQGARRVWSDSRGQIWVSEWNAGQLARYDPATNSWKEWKLPGNKPATYAVYVDNQDFVWVSDWGSNAIVRFDPQTEQFSSIPLPSEQGGVRQIQPRTSSSDFESRPNGYLPPASRAGRAGWRRRRG